MNHLRSILVLVMCIVILVSFALPVSAEILTWEDYIDTYTSDTVTCVMPSTDFLLHVMNGGTIIQELTGRSVTYTFSSGQDPGFRVYPFGAKNRMQLKDIPDGTQFDFTITVSNSANAVNGALACYIQYFDGDLVLLSTHTLQSYTGGIPYTWDISHTMDFPEGAEYFQIYLNLNGWTVLSSTAAYGISCSDLRFTMDVQYLPDDSAILDSINDKIDSLPDDIGDQMQDIVDNEKENAKNEGNSSVDDIIQVIPDYSTGFIEGIELLVSSLGYEGTECKVIMPALELPVLPGVTKSKITFLDSQEVDFEPWFNRMPSSIMAVTQAGFDIAVVLYCLYEFYDLISQLSNGARKVERD